MCGFPSETKEDLFMTIDLACNLLADNKNAFTGTFFIYKCYPNTKLAEMASAMGFRTPEELEEWGEYDWSKVVYADRPREYANLLSRVYIASIFLDFKMEKYSDSSLFLIMAAKLYRPIARFRFRHKFFSMMPEQQLFSILQKLST
jgi:hypothetical protein